MFEEYKTDTGGKFASTALWPGDRYKVTVTADGYGKAESPEIVGQAGEVYDFGAIRLVGASARVAGQVLDTAGKPVAGAIVFNRGDAPAGVTARTDPRGRFQLEGLLKGGKYIFVRKEGYRFTGTRVERDSDNVTITLRARTRPPPRGRRVRRPRVTKSSPWPDAC